MSQAARHANENQHTNIRLRQRFQVSERFLGLSEGQEVEIVEVSNETLVNGGRLKEVTFRLPNEVPSACGASEMPYHVDDVRRAIERGKLTLQ